MVPDEIAHDAPRGSASEHEPGAVVLGRYRIEREIGRGGQASVFEAEDLELGRRIALKILTEAPTADAGSDGGWEGLHAEARLQAAVEAPGVARLLDAQRDAHGRYLILELVRGPGLADVIREIRAARSESGVHGASGADFARAAGLEAGTDGFRALAGLDWSRTVAIFGAALARSVASLHERGLVHSDLKPANIRLDGAGQPVVLDFGLARWLDAPKSTTLRGTPGYMAPEQLRPGCEPDTRTDVFQVGLILYELLALQRAYAEDLVADTPRFVEVAREAGIAPVREVAAAADEGLTAVIERTLRRDPDDRYGDLAELAVDLERLVEGRAPVGVTTSMPYLVRARARSAVRRPFVAALLAAGLLTPLAWGIRAALTKEVTSIEGLCFSPEASAEFAVVSGSAVRVGDDLGVRVTSTTPRTVYALSVFGGWQSSERLVSPMRPSPLIGGVPESTGNRSWGIGLEPGVHELVCTRIVDPNPCEGLIVFATEEPSELFEDWFVALDEATRARRSGVSQEEAFALLDGVPIPAPTTRGSTFLPGPGASQEDVAKRLAEERLRYAGLSAAKASGEDEWDLGDDLVRFEVVCEVVAER